MQIKEDLDAITNKKFPEWVATVDVATGMIFYMNTGGWVWVGVGGRVVVGRGTVRAYVCARARVCACACVCVGGMLRGTVPCHIPGHTLNPPPPPTPTFPLCFRHVLVYAPGALPFGRTETKESSWEEPKGYTGMFALADRHNGFTATTQLSREGVGAP